MIDEATDLALDADRLNDVQRIVGRQYDEVEWYAIDVEFGDDTHETIRETFRWGRDQVLVPFVRAKYANIAYDARTMGLGEFSMHVMFWILEQYKDQKGLVVLLDEPDAYLPPVGVGPLLDRLLLICNDRDWNLVLATHSDELITEATKRKVFYLLRNTALGELEVLPSTKNPDVATFLLAKPPYKLLMFVEDESAWHLARALLDFVDRGLSRQVLIVWGNGYSYMTSMRPYMPKPPYAEVKFAYVFDGDQRERIDKSAANEWRSIYLPTLEDPDFLMKSLRLMPQLLADALVTPLSEMQRYLDTIEGEDPHDWVNKLGEQYERQRVLRALAALWVANHETDATAFVAEVRKI
ncbi:ATP-binding protein [Clavibacter michiganensis]|uniref:ATP-binding protein n=1 Tax=Clavibacter michiganensis TaxID=28447 RepID=UPI00117F0080|nr:ATP-binding protein [Clavibacter michiganensis]